MNLLNLNQVRYDEALPYLVKAGIIGCPRHQHLVKMIDTAIRDQDNAIMDIKISHEVISVKVFKDAGETSPILSYKSIR